MDRPIVGDLEGLVLPSWVVPTPPPMIVYHSTKAQFADDVLSNDIAGIVHRQVQRATGGRVGEREVLVVAELAPLHGQGARGRGHPRRRGRGHRVPPAPVLEAGRLSPLRARRRAGSENVVLVELKQWSQAERTGMDGIVRTRFKGRHGRHRAPVVPGVVVRRPCWTSFNATVEEDEHRGPAVRVLPQLRPAHARARPRPPVLQRVPREGAPLPEARRRSSLRAFIKRYVRHGDERRRALPDRARDDPTVEEPSPTSSTRCCGGNEEFVMLDEQKVVYERALALGGRADVADKHVLIVEGGPGHGEVRRRRQPPRRAHRARQGRAVRHQERGAPRPSTRSGSSARTRSRRSRTSSPARAPSRARPRRLRRARRRRGPPAQREERALQNLGENQILEIIRAAQPLRLLPRRGPARHVRRHRRDGPRSSGGPPSQAPTSTGSTLSSQFRCNGSDGYLAWLDHTLQIRDTANATLAPRRVRLPRRRLAGRAPRPHPGAERGEQGPDGRRATAGAG